jgi:hypothetical protein
MLELLKANLFTDFTYYRRSRLLLAFLIVFVLLTGMACIPLFFFRSDVRAFDGLHQIYTILNWMLLYFTAGLSLFIISSHLRNRSLKMVFTKPCTPAVWLTCAFASAVGVSLLFNAVILGGATIASLIWHLPVRPGLVFMSTYTFTTSVSLIAGMMFLATLLHPAVAVVLILIFNANTFYQLNFWTESVIRSGNKSHALRFWNHIFHSLYLMLPIFRVSDDQADAVSSGLHVSHGAWKYLLYSAGYAAAISVFFYFASLLALQRRKHI